MDRLQSPLHYVYVTTSHMVHVTDTNGRTKYCRQFPPILALHRITDDQFAIDTRSDKYYVWTISTDSIMRLRIGNAKLVAMFKTSPSMLVSISYTGQVTWWRDDDGSSCCRKQLPKRRLQLSLNNDFSCILHVEQVPFGFMVVWRGNTYQLYDSSFTLHASFIDEPAHNDIQEIIALDPARYLFIFPSRFTLWKIGNDRKTAENCYYVHHDSTNVYGIGNNGSICGVQEFWIDGTFQYDCIAQLNKIFINGFSTNLTVYTVDSKRFLYYRNYGKQKQRRLVLYDYVNQTYCSSVRIRKMISVKLFDTMQLCGHYNDDNSFRYVCHWPDVNHLSTYHTCRLYDFTHANNRIAFFVIQLEESKKKLVQLTCDFLAPWIPVVDLQKIVAAFM